MINVLYYCIITNMNYRKQKKILTKYLALAMEILDAHPLSNSARAQVKYVKHELLSLKRVKYENLGSYCNARADGSD